MTMLFNLPLSALLATLLIATSCSDSRAQSGLNGGKPIVTFNTTGAIRVKTQSPPSFPGGEDRLNDFVLDQLEETESPVRVGRKKWLTATIDKTGRITDLIPTDDADPTLRKELARVASRMPRWQPGTINGQGVETRFQFLLRR